MFQGNWLWRPQASGPVFAHSWFHLILIERFGARDNNAIVLQPRLIRPVQCCHVFIPPVGGDHHFDALEPHFVCKHVCSTVSKRHFLGGALKNFAVLGHSHRRAFVKDDAFMHQRVELTQVGLFSRATIHHESLGGARQETSKNCFAHTRWPSENKKTCVGTWVPRTAAERKYRQVQCAGLFLHGEQSGFCCFLPLCNGTICFALGMIVNILKIIPNVFLGTNVLRFGGGGCNLLGCPLSVTSRAIGGHPDSTDLRDLEIIMSLVKGAAGAPPPCPRSIHRHVGIGQLEAKICRLQGHSLTRTEHGVEMYWRHTALCSDFTVELQSSSETNGNVSAISRKKRQTPAAGLNRLNKAMLSECRTKLVHRSCSRNTVQHRPRPRPSHHGS